MNKKIFGKVYIISSPSGGGKTSLLRAFLAQYPNAVSSISYTTRKMREKEQHGIDYYFISKPEFKQMIRKNRFIEYAEVFGNYYGTTTESFQRLMEQGRDVVLEIDWQGAQQIRKVFKKNCISIFIKPITLSVLYDRLLKRRQDSEETIRQRMKQAAFELSHSNEYDYIIVNDDFKDALKDLESCFRIQKAPGLEVIENFYRHLVKY